MLILLTLAALRLPAPPTPETDRLPTIALPRELARVLTDYEAAWRAQDAAALASLFIEDGFVLSPGKPPVRGRDAIRREYTGAGGPLALRALVYATEGSVGYIIGAFARREGEPDVGKFTLTLRRERGRWMIVSDLDNGNRSSPDPSAVLDRVDHLIYGAPDLDAAIARLEERLGVRASAGGSHPGRGTRNALIALGTACYLEIMAPDPDQPPPAEPRWFGVDALPEPRFVGWAAKGRNLEVFAAKAARGGVRLGAVKPGGRRRPDGVVLSWKVTDPFALLGDGIVPFFIDWGQSPHPALIAAPGARLSALRAEHPNPDGVRDVIRRLGVDLRVEYGPAPALNATFATPRGEVELR
jgi:ketosteroid isomerase-like protein